MDKENGGLNIQDGYLARARKDRAVLTVFLNNGKKIVGRIRAFDRYTLVLEDHGQEQMIFKHAISTISVSRSFANPIPFDRAEKGAPPPGRGPEAPGPAGGPARGPGSAQEGEAAGPGAPAPPADKPRAAD